MAREQFKTLSEPMYYILLALTEECCGVDVMKQVKILSGSRVVVGPGTLYTLLARFEESKAIRQTVVEGRKRSYVITEYGKTLLQQEHQRLLQMHLDGKQIMEEF